MKKAEKLMKILSENYTKPIPEKYAKVILQVATLEERVSAMMSFGLTEKAKEISAALFELIQAIRDEHERDNPNNKK